MRLFVVNSGYVDSSLQREPAHCVFADAAEIEGAVVFHDVGNLGVAVGRAVLEVFNDPTLWIKAEDEGIALGRWLKKFGEPSDHLPQTRVRQHSIEERLARSHECDPEAIATIGGNAVRKAGQVVDENVVLA